jgi:superfamily II DNA/RNA helicase
MAARAASSTSTLRRPKRRTRKDNAAKQPKAEKRLSRNKRPEEMSLEAWQTELRRQYGREQNFKLKNVGDEPIFSEFEVTNPQSKRTYRVAIRGGELGVNFCSCPDFTTNTLGTCKHVEFTLARLQAKRGAKQIFAAGYRPAYSEVCLQYGAERVVRFHAGADCPPEMSKLAARFFDDEQRLPPENVGRFDEFLQQASRIDHDLRVYDDALALVAQRRDAEHRAQVLAREFPAGIRSAAFKKLLKVDLYDYQREGALFAARAGRSLIGDEMGLGKTVQAIAAAEIMARHFGVERVLIVCPTSLKHQWEREISRFTDRQALVVGGLKPQRNECYAAEGCFFKIANYDTVHRDLSEINAWSPDLVILDEAQRIKNWNTRAANSVKQIESPYCVVLTGTPLENRLEELVSIVQFIDRHRLGPTFRFLEHHQQYDEGTNRVIGYRHLDEIGKTLAPVLLRRRKDQVLNQLPERLDKYLFVPMTEQQFQYHNENREIVARIVLKWRRYGYLSDADQTRLMIALQNMRMSCNSTYLLDKQTDFSTKPDELATLLGEILEQPQAKVVLFSQWVRMHELVQRRVEKRGWQYALFNGSIPSVKRKAVIDRFREDSNCRLLLATDAGGVGLNLQFAQTVINLDMPWNPAILEQRNGRVHRLGQTQPVRVVNFVAQGTIEHGMLSLLSFKKSMFAGVLDGGEQNVFLGESRLGRFIKTVEKATSSIPQHEAEPESADAADRGAREEAADSGENGRAQNGRRRSQPASESARDSASAGTTAAAKVAAPSASPAGDAAADPLSGLIQNGLALLAQLAGASSRGSQSTTDAAPGSASKREAGPSSGLQVLRDEQTGRPYLKMPVPDPQVVEDAMHALIQLVAGLQQKS